MSLLFTSQFLFLSFLGGIGLFLNSCQIQNLMSIMPLDVWREACFTLQQSKPEIFVLKLWSRARVCKLWGKWELAALFSPWCAVSPLHYLWDVMWNSCLMFMWPSLISDVCSMNTHQHLLSLTTGRNKKGTVDACWLSPSIPLTRMGVLFLPTSWHWLTNICLAFRT